MNFWRMWAMFLRYFYSFAKLDSLSQLFYWPAIDISLWGMTSIWIQSSQDVMSDIASIVLTGIVFWQVVWRGSYEITINILEEFWNRNFVNIFSTPLRLVEWMGAVMFGSVIKSLISLVFSGLFVWTLFDLNIYQVGWSLVPYFFLLILSGWTMGYLSGALMIYFGQRMQMLAWITPFVFAPFSAMVYPLSALPLWAQKIGYCLPMTYVFEGIRKVLRGEGFSFSYFGISLVLNLFLLGGSIALFVFFFEKSRSKGLSRLE